MRTKKKRWQLDSLGWTRTFSIHYQILLSRNAWTCYCVRHHQVTSSFGSSYLILTSNFSDQSFKVGILYFLKQIKNLFFWLNAFEQDVNNWLEEVEQIASPSACKILVGNKLDLQTKREVTREEAEEYAAQKKIPFVECSSLTGENVDDVKKSFWDLQIGLKCSSFLKNRCLRSCAKKL